MKTKYRIGSLIMGMLLLETPFLMFAQKSPVGKIAFEPYKFRTFDGKEYDAEIGKLVLQENRNTQSTSTIQLTAVRLKSFSSTPAAPIVFLAGGPGAPAIGMGRVPVYFSLFQKLRDVADVILMDQRGCGMSMPNLECSSNGRSANVFQNDKTWLSTFENMSKACAEHWRKKGVDLSAYTSEASADDLNDLRKALDVPKISLIGHSYGTFLAQVTIRRHGEYLEKLVLANTDGTGDFLASPDVWDMLIKKLSLLTRSDTSINKTIPDFEQMYRTVLTQLEKKPVLIKVMDYEKKKQVELTVGKIGMQWIVRNYMNDARKYSIMPAFIYSVYNGDYSILAKEIEPIYNSFKRSVMATAIDCSIGWSYSRKLEMEKMAKGSMFSNVNLQWSGKVCELIGIKRAGDDTRTNIFSTLPTLFISGTLDTNTPPFQAEKLRWGFPNSTHIVIENAGHETLPSKEVQALVIDFFKGMDVSDRHIRFSPPDFISLQQLKSMSSEKYR